MWAALGPWGPGARTPGEKPVDRGPLGELKGRGSHQAEPQGEQVSSGQGHSTSSHPDPSAAVPLVITLQIRVELPGERCCSSHLGYGGE